MATQVPLIGQPQPQFPHIGVQIIPQGMIVAIQLGPTTTISQVIDGESMDKVCKAWSQQRQNNMDFLHAVQATKNG